MSKQQQDQLDAILRQGQLDTAGDVAILRAAFNELMAQVPVPADLQPRHTTIGGVDAVEVTVQDRDADNVILYFHGGVYVIGTAAASVPSVPSTRTRRRSKMPKPRTRDFSVRASTLVRSLSQASRQAAGWRWPHCSPCERRARHCRPVPS
jgi:hypothetical protein